MVQLKLLALYETIIKHNIEYHSGKVISGPTARQVALNVNNTDWHKMRLKKSTKDYALVKDAQIVHISVTTVIKKSVEIVEILDDTV